MKVSSYAFAAVAVFTSPLARIARADVDGSLCSYNAATSQCLPAALCGLQTSTSCRVKPNAAKLPQQIHLAYAGASTGTAMAISWATFEHVFDSAVWVGSSADTLELRAEAKVSSTSYYSDNDYSLYQNHAVVTGLAPGTKYYYRVGSQGDPLLVSEVSSFSTARLPSDPTAFDVIVYGDLGFGYRGERSAEYINSLASMSAFVYHIGDISYADDDYYVTSQANGFFYEKVYKKWMNSLTPTMGTIPYMVTVGNHEVECNSPACKKSPEKLESLRNYTAYNARFRMPSHESNGVLNMWYSFEYGPIHFTSISSETDYPQAPTNTDAGQRNGGFGNQLSWLENDLQKAEANRKNVPWIIVGMHRPIYHRFGCDASFNPRDDSLALQKAFEELFLKYKVDLVFAGHDHAYERQFPTARGSAVMDGVSTDAKTYTNPKAPVYIVTGGPGGPEQNSVSGRAGTVPWNVMETARYGISVMRVTRDSIWLKYVASTETPHDVLDDFVITKS